ncbi:LysM peptidoglycan-binding domain-containing protein [Diaminobutyricibacter tongyongensis]|uniref:LysM peptidoglycan-binding domain-containing protein n=1 Tax=Leifsonia tongyongensis TaxID=1268043 RepID=A0A6L9XXD2_9MICO|nr:LysM peptidoglycan-binding domain-containing protein [Diaminobutyricibacter tongyongensis]NEN06082.1 LysM peptidoglycan-binding domain-containing protein [Diaminobutyricibacter tongyongensis]
MSRAVLATVPIAIASSLAMTLTLITPAQAAAPDKGGTAPSGAKTPDAAGAATGTVTPPSAASDTASEPRFDEAAVPANAVPANYTVVSGDTVSGIAGRYGLSTASVLALNGLSWKSLIFPGQVLALGGSASPSPIAPKPATAPRHATPPVHAPTTARHIVVAGDTISGIAEEHGVSTQAVLSANGLDRSSLIFPGQSITIPLGSTAALRHAAPAARIPSPSASKPVAPAPSAPAPAPSRVIAMTDEMRANAAIIVSVGRREGVDDYGLVIALAAAMQESRLRNVHYGDRDSLGIFQQRPSTGWGTPAQVMDPYRAARAFFGGRDNPNPGRTRGLLDIPGWHSMPVTRAAQAVQLSAFPNAYAKWEASARAWVAQLR